MSTSLITWGLLAQISKWSRLGDGIHRSKGRVELVDLIPFAIAILAIALVTAIFIYYKKRNDFSKPCNDPQKLFRELSGAHKLDRGSQNLLMQLATTFQLDQPAEIFLQPGLFEVDQLPEHLRAEKAQFARLEKQLF